MRDEELILKTQFPTFNLREKVEFLGARSVGSERLIHKPAKPPIWCTRQNTGNRRSNFLMTIMIKK